MRRSAANFTGHQLLPALLVAAASAAGATPTSPRPQVQDASARIDRFADQLSSTPGSFPAIAVVIATPDTAPTIYVKGRLNNGQPGPVTRKSQFYIASQTKAFVGLLAARLDEKRILPLGMTLAQVWPNLRLPSSADPRKITMLDLLTHRVPLRTDRLNFATAYVRSIRSAELAPLLATDTQVKPPTFAYANLGYLIYGAAVEARTGRHWQDWLDQEVLKPLRLRGTNATPGANVNLTWSHEWSGGEWRAYPPKPDALRHAAGGLVSSPDDLGRWIQANLDPAKGTAGLASAIVAAQVKQVDATLSDGEIKCDGYALGWYNCAYKGEPFLLSTGEFVGTQSFTMVAPRLRVGLSLVATSDSRVQALSLELIKAFIGLSKGDLGEQARLDKFAAAYPTSVKALGDKRAAAQAATRTDPEWGGWSWHPGSAERARIAGHFADPVLGPVDIVRQGEGLQLRMGAFVARLEPATPNLFAAWSNWSATPDKLAYDPATDTVTFRGWRIPRARR